MKRKELAYYATGPGEPSFIILKDFEGLSLDTGDYIGVYSSDGYCRGCDQIRSANNGGPVNSITKGFCNEPTPSGKKTGFNYNEEMFMFYYDRQSDKFYNLTGTYRNYYDVANGNDRIIDKLTYASLNIFMVSDIVIGEEISLNIDEELIEPLLEINQESDIIETGKPKRVDLGIKTRNINNLTCEIIEGSGQVYRSKQWPYKYFYEASPTPGHVVGRFTAIDSWDEDVINSEFEIDVQITQDDNVKIWEDDRVAFFEKDGDFYFRSKLGEVYLQHRIGMLSAAKMRIGDEKLMTMEKLKIEASRTGNNQGYMLGSYFYYTGPEHPAYSKETVNFRFEIPGSIPEEPVEEILYNDDIFTIKTIDDGIFGETTEQFVMIKFIYNGRYVTKRLPSAIKLFNLDDCKQNGLEIKQVIKRVNSSWVKDEINTVLFTPINPDAGKVILYSNPPSISNPFIDEPYVKFAYDGDNVIGGNFITERLTVRFRPSDGIGFIYSSSILAGSTKTFPKRYLESYIGKKITMDWSVNMSEIKGSVEFVV